MVEYVPFTISLFQQQKGIMLHKVEIYLYLYKVVKEGDLY